MSSEIVDQVALDANPFAILDVTTRDSRERIHEAVEDRSLVVDPDACSEARAILTAPRRRFEAELGWFPGVAPSTAKRAVEAGALDEVEALPIGGLAMANALGACALKHPPASLDQFVDFLKNMSSAVDEVSLSAVLRDVNEDREISGFPPFVSEDAAEQMLRDRHQVWLEGVMAVMLRLPTSIMAEGLYRASERMAGEKTFPRFMHDIVEKYALRAQPFLTEEMAGASRLIEKAREMAPTRPQGLPPLVDAVAALLATWEEITKPIQLSMTILGRTDRESERLGYMVRDLSIELHNEHQLSEEAGRISALLAKHFASLPQLAARASEDGQTLENLVAEAKRNDADFAYAAEIGTFRKTRLAISRQALEWKGETYSIDEIRSARWGAIRKSVNGVPTGTDYLISWSDSGRTATVDFRNGVIYDAFTQRLWRVLAEPMLSKIISKLRDGSEFHVGTAIFRDESVTLPCSKIFGDKRSEFGWDEVTIRTADGSFIIQGPAKSKASASLSFRDVPNVHFFEALVRAAFKNGHTQLSMAFG